MKVGDWYVSEMPVNLYSDTFGYVKKPPETSVMVAHIGQDGIARLESEDGHYSHFNPSDLFRLFRPETEEETTLRLLRKGAIQ